MIFTYFKEHAVKCVYGHTVKRAVSVRESAPLAQAPTITQGSISGNSRQSASVVPPYCEPAGSPSGYARGLHASRSSPGTELSAFWPLGVPARRCNAAEDPNPTVTVPGCCTGLSHTRLLAAPWGPPALEQWEIYKKLTVQLIPTHHPGSGPEFLSEGRLHLTGDNGPPLWKVCTGLSSVWLAGWMTLQPYSVMKTNSWFLLTIVEVNEFVL